MLKNEAIDVALIVGTDPVSSLPFEVVSKLSRVKTIVIDPRLSLTARIADIVIPSAISGVEASGTMVRSDGVRFKLEAIDEKAINDVYILNRLLEGL